MVIGEELGWRGYAQPQLEKRYSSFTAAVILGVLWGFWHLPNFFIPSMPHFEIPLVAFILYTTSLSVLAAWVLKSTRGSVLLTTLLHGSTNTFGFLTPGLDNTARWWLIATLYAASALVVVIAARGELLTRKGKTSMKNTSTQKEANLRPQTDKPKRGFGFYIKRGLLGLLILLVALPVLGFIYETIMRAGDAQRYPPPGQMVNVDGHQMHILCTGEGSPTVILEAGANDYSLTWSRLQPVLSQSNRVCSYDRAGYGWSDPGPEPRNPQQIATELHKLLAEAGIAAPYVMVGHSNGGKFVRMYASIYPNEVAGVVLEDARHESMEPHDRTPEQNAQDRKAYRSTLNLYATLGRLGVARLFGPSLLKAGDPSIAHLPAEIQWEMANIAVQQDTLDTMDMEGHYGLDNDAQLATATLGNMPLIVLTAKSSMQFEPRWEQAQNALTSLSTNNQWLIVENSSHMIHLDQPAVEIDAIHAVIASWQTGAPLAP